MWPECIWWGRVAPGTRIYRWTSRSSLWSGRTGICDKEMKIGMTSNVDSIHACLYLYPILPVYINLDYNKIYKKLDFWHKIIEITLSPLSGDKLEISLYTHFIFYSILSVISFVLIIMDVSWILGKGWGPRSDIPSLEFRSSETQTRPRIFSYAILGLEIYACVCVVGS